MPNDAIVCLVYISCYHLHPVKQRDYRNQKYVYYYCIITDRSSYTQEYQRDGADDEDDGTACCAAGRQGG